VNPELIECVHLVVENIQVNWKNKGTRKVKGPAGNWKCELDLKEKKSTDL
jgi:hypothetical protein